MGKLRLNLSPILIAVLVLVVGILIRNLFTGFNNLLGDLLLEPKAPGNEIVILTIDDASIAKIGQWPWPREEYAKLIGDLNAHPPKALGIDVLFAEESRAGAADDNKLAKALETAKFPVVLASRESDGVVPLSKFINENTFPAEVGLIVDPDGVVRRVSTQPSFAIGLAHFGSGIATTDESKKFERIVWSGKVGSFRRIPFYRLSDVKDKEIAVSLKDKIVIIGSTATDLHDEQLTAIDRGVAMPGVEIQANLANMYLANYAYKEIDFTGFVLLLILASLIPALCFILLKGVYQPLIGSIIGFAILLLALVVAWQREIAAPILYPLLVYILSTIAQLLYRYFGSERARKELKNIFGKYVSGAVLAEILNNPSKVKLGGEEREATILFSDVRGFTTFSESMTPTELVTFLNRYLSRMTNVIIANKGVIDKYIGDAIMAFWGAPLPSTIHARESIVAATEMSDALNILNEENKNLGIQEVHIGIGLHTGPVVAGNMGSEHRFDYTVMGDTVNLSSRLEGLTKNYGIRIMASEETVKSCDQAKLESEGISFREIDQVLVKGKHKPTRIFEVIPASRKADFDKIASRYAEALQYYYKGNWDKCLRLLAEIETIVETDGPTKTLKERCLQFKIVSPANWEGVYEHKSK